MADLGLAQSAASLAGAKVGGLIGQAAIPIPGLGMAIGSLVGSLAGKLVPGRTSRYATLTPNRINFNAFTQGCVRSGVGSAVCPIGELQRQASISQKLYPNAYRTVYQPLLGQGPRPTLQYLQGLASAYLSKRRMAPGAAEAARKLGVSLSAPSAGGGYALARSYGLRL